MPEPKTIWELDPVGALTAGMRIPLAKSGGDAETETAYVTPAEMAAWVRRNMGAGSLRTLTGVQGEYPYDTVFIWQITTADLNGTVIVPYYDGAVHTVSWPPEAVEGDSVIIIYGDPASLLDGLPGIPTALVFAPLPVEVSPGVFHAGFLIPPGGDIEEPVSLAYGAVVTAKFSGSVEEVPFIYHLWSTVALTAALTAAATEGGGGGSTDAVVRYASYAYGNPDESGFYNDFGLAVAALTAVGGGTLEVAASGASLNGDALGNSLDMHGIHLVGKSYYTTPVSFNVAGDLAIYGLLSLKNLTITRSYEAGISGLFNVSGGNKLVIEDCDVGAAYPASLPIIQGNEYQTSQLTLLGKTRLGEGSVGSLNAIYMELHDSSTVFEDAVTATALTAHIYGSGTVDPSQAGVSGAVTVVQQAMERVIPVAIGSGSHAPTVWANRFFEADTTGGAVVLAAAAVAFGAGSSIPSVGARAWVAKRANGGSVTVNGLTYVPGGGTSYVITVENDVAQLIWLEGGIQVVP